MSGIKLFTWLNPTGVQLRCDHTRAHIWAMQCPGPGAHLVAAQVNEPPGIHGTMGGAQASPRLTWAPRQVPNGNTKHLQEKRN